MDGDGNGFIDAGELKEAIALASEENGLEISNDEINKMIYEMDYAGNGQINFTEFLAATVDVEQFLTNEKIEAIFDAFDVSNDDVISTDDLKVAFSKFGREISA